MKKNLRKYGTEPFRAAVIHGGPGAPGEMAPVARELAAITGILEPLQTAASLDGQVQELRAVLRENADLPVTLIGWSWGAMLSFIFAAGCPRATEKLVLIGSPPFEEEYAGEIMKTRMSRLGERDRMRALSLMDAMNDPAATDRDTPLARLGKLLSRADSYDPLPQRNKLLECRYDTYQSVWQQARELRASGRLVALGSKIHCPVLAIHGDWDPHPARGVREPLSRVLGDFRFILLENCGHKPWVERAARDRFYAILKEELS